jgi:hypothetical protein
MFIEIFKIIDYMKCKANQIYLKKKKNSRCDVHTLPKKLIAERLYV